MIISASRRTDIPTLYVDWFFNRMKEGYVLVRNPFNFHQVGKISLSPEVVDGIVFWTKNPLPMMQRLDELEGYHYYFQFTLNSYAKEMEGNIPSKKEVVIPAFQALSKKIGREKVVWRYDPIFLNETYTMEYHMKYFKELAAKLSDYTEKCTVSFLDLYRNTQRNMKQAQVQLLSNEQKFELMACFSETAKQYGMSLDTCAEEIELERLGITHAHCIDKQRFEQMSGFRLNIDKDVNQRPECGCVSSIDIGTYNTCTNGCIYCYANNNHKTARSHYQAHSPRSPLLFGELEENDVVKERRVASCKECQLDLFQQ